jgi:hypothetical protein
MSTEAWIALISAAIGFAQVIIALMIKVDIFRLKCDIYEKFVTKAELSSSIKFQERRNHPP